MIDRHTENYLRRIEQLARNHMAAEREYDACEDDERIEALGDATLHAEIALFAALDEQPSPARNPKAKAPVVALVRR